MSVLQSRHNETKLLESEKCIDEEYTVESRQVSHLPQNFVQYWVDTGHLPSRFCMDTAVHSDTGSSLSEEEASYKHYATCNTMLKHKLNDKQLCNNGSSNSSVDTAAYVLSNTNVTKKENIYPRFFKKDGILKIHKDINYKNNENDTAVNIYDTINSSISNKKCAFDIYSSNEMYQNDKELEDKNIIEDKNMEEEIVLRLSPSCEGDTVEMCKNDKQVNENDLNYQDKEFSENSIQETVNITNANKYNSLCEDLHNDSIRHSRQKKLYVGRESPIDINISVVSESVDSDVNKNKQNLHPAYRNSPLLRKPHRKFMPKKRKYKFFLSDSRDKSQNNTSSNNSTSDNINVEACHAKRQKSLEDPESHVDETQLFSTISPTSGKDKLRQSCREMEKQIKRFTTSEFIHINELTELKKNLRCGYELRSKIKRQENVAQEEINAKPVSRNILNKKHNPIVLLERLSEKTIEHYINRKDLKSEKTKKNSAWIKNMTKCTNKRNHLTRSLRSIDMEPHSQLENVIVDSGNSNTSTMIIYNHTNCQSTNCYDGNDAANVLNSMPLSNSHNAEKTQLEKFSSDIKLIQMRPVVVLERLHSIEQCKKEHLSKLNNLKNKLQPIIVLESLANIDRNSSYNINSLACNKYNKTNTSTVENKKTKKRMDYNYKHSKKLLYFKTNMNSDSDSDVSFTKSTFNLNTSMKYNKENKINQKSSNSLKINMLEDHESTKEKKTSFSKIFTTKELDNMQESSKSFNMHMSMQESIADMSTSNEHSSLGKVSCINKIDNSLQNFKRSGNKQKVHTLLNIQLTSNTSKKTKDILKNSVKNTVAIDANAKKKINKFVFVTKAYDSDSD